MMRFTFVLINIFVIICAVTLCALTPAGATTAAAEAGHDVAGKSVCELPKVTGPCRKADPVYYHNAATKQCEEFLYGGCLGNDNRFHTKDDCERTCSVAKAIAAEATASDAAVTPVAAAPVTATDH